MERPSTRPRSRHERQFRRRIKRELITAKAALVQFTLQLHTGQLDHLPYTQLLVEHNAVITRYAVAHGNYNNVFGRES